MWCKDLVVGRDRVGQNKMIGVLFWKTANAARGILNYGKKNLVISCIFQKAFGSNVDNSTKQKIIRLR